MLTLLLRDTKYTKSIVLDQKGRCNCASVCEGVGKGRVGKNKRTQFNSRLGRSVGRQLGPV